MSWGQRGRLGLSLAVVTISQKPQAGRAFQDPAGASQGPRADVGRRWAGSRGGGGLTSDAGHKGNTGWGSGAAPTYRSAGKQRWPASQRSGCPELTIWLAGVNINQPGSQDVPGGRPSTATENTGLVLEDILPQSVTVALPADDLTQARRQSREGKQGACSSPMGQVTAVCGNHGPQQHPLPLPQGALAGEQSRTLKAFQSGRDASSGVEGGMANTPGRQRSDRYPECVDKHKNAD